jgi:hypothetical protein
VITLDFLWVGYELLVDVEERWFMQDRKERCPLLEVNIDAAIGEEARRGCVGLFRGLGTKRLTALDMQERFCMEISARFSGFLNFALEGV